MNINSKYYKQIDQLIEDIIPLPKHYYDKFYIAGSTLLYLFQNKLDRIYRHSNNVRDIDLFFNDEKEGIVCSERILSEDNSWFEMETNNSVNFLCKNKKEGNSVKVQLIKKIFSDPEEMINNFDFTVCSCAYLPHLKKFIYVDTFFEDLKKKKLTFNKTPNIGLSYKRVEKYVYEKGFKMDKELKYLIKNKKLCTKCKNKLQCITSGKKECEEYNF